MKKDVGAAGTIAWWRKRLHTGNVGINGK